MTKRIFAIVLALVMSMSLFALDVFAAGFNVTAAVSGNSIVVSWNAVTGATEYHASLWKDGVKVGNSVENIVGTTYTFASLATGNYTVMVCPIANEAPVTGYSAVSSNAVTVGGVISENAWVENGMVKWNLKTGVTAYDVYFVNSAGYMITNKFTTSGNTFNLSAGPANAWGVVIFESGYTDAAHMIGRTQLTGTGGTTGTGNVYVSNNTLYWTTNYSGTYTVKFYDSANKYITSYQTSNKNWPLTYAPTVAVRAEVLIGSTVIGSCYLSGGNMGNYNASVYLTGRTNNTATISWQNMNSTEYYVKYTGRSGQSTTILATTTQATIPCDTSETVQIEITVAKGVYMGQKLTATLTPNGITGATTGNITNNTGNLVVNKVSNGYLVSWASTGGLYQVSYKKSNDAVYTTLNVQQTNSVVVPFAETDTWTINVAYYTGVVGSQFKLLGSYTHIPTSAGSTTGTTTTGSGCTVTSTATSSTVTWAGSLGLTYTVVYTADGQTARSLTTSYNSITLPVGNNTNFTVFVLANNQIIASAEVKKASSSTTTPDTPVVDEEVAYDTVTGFWAETLGDGEVKLSWNAVEDADNYKVYYRKAGTTKWSGGDKSFTRTKTYINIKFKSTSTYEFKVVAGDEESTVLTIKPGAAKGTVAWAMNADSDADYETNLAAVVKDADDGKITLTWEEVEDAKYKVYYRKAGTTTWKGGYDRSGESITITFKASNTDNTYEIMIKADGDESDIFVLTPAVWANAD